MPHDPVKAGQAAGPARYTHGHHESVLRSHRWRTPENSCGYLLGELHAGVRLLDVGCGPGNLSADLADLVAPGEVVAIDNAPGVVEAARAEAAARGTRNVDVRVADVSALPFPDGHFDVVHAHQVLQHLADPVAALAEMRRVCRPGGVVAARDADYPAMAWHPRPAGLDRWLACYLAVARSNGAEPAAGRRLRAWAFDAGFAEVHASASAWCFGTDDERSFWGGLWADRVTGSALADQAVETGAATAEDLAAMAEAWRAWAADPSGVFLVVHGEVRCRG